MNKVTIIMLVILAVLIAITVVLYFYGKKMEKRQAEQKAELDAVARQITMLVIDKKMMKFKEAGLPAAVVESTPKYMRRAKVPIVKAKVGPKITTLMCDSEIFPLVPVKKEVKATVSGIYITQVRGIRGPLDTPPKKKRFLSRLRGGK